MEPDRFMQVIFLFLPLVTTVLGFYFGSRGTESRMQIRIQELERAVASGREASATAQAAVHALQESPVLEANGLRSDASSEESDRHSISDQNSLDSTATQPDAGPTIQILERSIAEWGDSNHHLTSTAMAIRRRAEVFQRSSYVFGAVGVLIILSGVVAVYFGAIPSATLTSVAGALPALAGGLIYTQSRSAGREAVRAEASLREQVNYQQRLAYGIQVASMVKNSKRRDDALASVLTAAIAVPKPLSQ